MHHRQVLAAALLSLAALGSAHAVNVPVLPGSGWQEFVVDDPQYSIAGTDFAWHDLAGNGDVSFTFSVPVGQFGKLFVVDAIFGGDVFSVKSNGTQLANTSAAVNTYPNDAVADYDAAYADARFSKNLYGFSAGTYTITGSLFSSALDDVGQPLNSTLGALKLEIAPVPEASTLAMLLAGLGAVGMLTRRRAI
jgi:hypothetical protein